MKLRMLVWVAAGGALGAVLRYSTVSWIARYSGTGFPYGTLAVNVLGSLILGALVEVFALLWNPPAELRAMIVVGALGAFTTFSTFSLDTWFLYDKGALSLAALYVVASVVLSVSGFALGLWAARTVLV